MNNMKNWQVRILTSVWITYFSYYLCRYNMPMAKSQLCNTFSWDIPQMGIVFTSLTVMYAIGQFVNGQLADRFGSRIIASIGIFGSVLMNLAVFLVIKLSPPEMADPDFVLLQITLFWGANGFFQSMGWSPMVRIVTHWFPVETRGKTTGILGTSYQIGGAFSWFLAFFLTGYYVTNLGGDWTAVFWVPALIFSIVGIFFYFLIRNTPKDAGFAEIDSEEKIENTKGEKSQGVIAQNILRTLKNPYLWVVAGTFFLLDLNRYGFVNWLPSFMESRASTGSWFKEVMKLCIHPLAGSVGAIVAGWATDNFFGGRRAPVIAILLLILGVCSIIFPYLPNQTALIIFIVAVIGFCTYGPHILMAGHAAQDFGKKSGVAGAAGFIDAMGYIGASLAGWGAGVLIKKWDYNLTFVVFGVAAILGSMLVCLIWKAGPKTKVVN
jgi:MFS transporter, OPA family, glycerol-3-phosphate transporter